MSMLEKLNNDMKAAMKARDKDRLQTIRMLKSALQNEALAKRDSLTEDEELTVLAREKKQRLDSLEEFNKAGRTDLVEGIQLELDIVSKYLPEQLSDDDIVTLVKSVIDEIGASGMQDMGKVMSAVMPKVRGRADGNLVNQTVKSELAK